MSQTQAICQQGVSLQSKRKHQTSPNLNKCIAHYFSLYMFFFLPLKNLDC